jgi:hypothetical protein
VPAVTGHDEDVAEHDSRKKKAGPDDFIQVAG